MSNSSSPPKLPLSQEIENPSSFNFNSSSRRISVHARDLPEGKNTKSNILAAAEELVVVQSLTSLKKDTQPTLLEQECKSQDLVPHSVQPVFDQTPITMGVNSEEKDKEEILIVWSRKGVEGLITEVAPETTLEDEPTESQRKRKKKIKRKGKMVESSNKGDKRRYATKGVVQKQRRILRVRTEEPTSLQQEIGSSDTESDDIVREVVKRNKEGEEERKSHVKWDRVTKKASSKPKSGKGPSSTAQKQVEGRVLTREERVSKLENQKVLNGRVFNPKILTEHGMSTFFDFLSLKSWEHLFECPVP
ncbi:hypothetical protein H5410_027275 [Solanum commersonii]|uniref:Uncharacterized protein n=1 Tax=Solanum commersonii TaxID=4109 RepID=A0A9J5Z1I6_SOLCO|nr:hypothetical protein H5410_027275 [Solanum commersonii]